MRVTILIVFFSIAFPVAALDASSMSPPAAAYYQCMMQHAAKYGRKAANAAEAIEAARSSCQKQRGELQIDVYAQLAAKEAIEGGPMNESQLNRRASRVVDKVDEKIHPDLVRSAFEAK